MCRAPFRGQMDHWILETRRDIINLSHIISACDSIAVSNIIANRSKYWQLVIRQKRFVFLIASVECLLLAYYTIFVQHRLTARLKKQRIRACFCKPMINFRMYFIATLALCLFMFFIIIAHLIFSIVNRRRHYLGIYLYIKSKYLVFGLEPVRALSQGDLARNIDPPRLWFTPKNYFGQYHTLRAHLFRTKPDLGAVWDDNATSLQVLQSGWILSHGMLFYRFN